MMNYIQYSLPNCLTIENVESVTGDMHAVVEQPVTILTLDASATEIITTPGMQLLLSLYKTLIGSGGKLRICNIRASCAESFRILGLQAQLDAWGGPHA